MPCCSTRLIFLEFSWRDLYNITQFMYTQNYMRNHYMINPPWQAVIVFIFVPLPPQEKLIDNKSIYEWFVKLAVLRNLHILPLIPGYPIFPSTLPVVMTATVILWFVSWIDTASCAQLVVRIRNWLETINHKLLEHMWKNWKQMCASSYQANR